MPPGQPKSTPANIPKVRSVSSPEKKINHTNFFAGSEPSIYTRQNISDIEINNLKNIIANFNYGQLTAKRESDPVYKLIEFFPAHFSNILGGEIRDMGIQKTDDFLDIKRGVDFIISFDNFAAAIAIDITGNPTKSTEKIFFKENERLFKYEDILNSQSVKKLDRYSGGKLLNINLYLDTKEFGAGFARLSSNPKLSKKEIYLILLKKFYLDKITSFMCDFVSGGKTTSLQKIKNFILKDEERLGNNSNKKINLTDLDERQITVLDVLLRLDKNFYTSQTVLDLNAKIF